MQIDKSMISNLASDNQTYLYAAGQTPETSGKKKQRSRAERWESDDEGGDPDSDSCFTLAVLDSQSFMRKITLRIIQAALSHVGTRWNAAANKGTIASPMHESVIYHNENSIGENYDILRRNDQKLKCKLVDSILRTYGHAARDHREKIAHKASHCEGFVWHIH